MRSRPTIGVLTPLLGGFYFGGLLRGIYQEAQRREAQVIAVQSRDAWQPFGVEMLDQPALPTSSILGWEHVDGWIAILNESSLGLLRAVKDSGKPLVTLSSLVPGIDCPAVLPDNLGGTFSAVRHLIEHGHQKIGFVGSLDQEDIRQRYAGYQQALREAGIEPDPAWFFPASDNIQYGAHGSARAMLAAGMPVSAVVVGTDLNAIGLMEVLQAEGQRVPEDLAIIGFDDIAEAATLTPPLTSVRQRFDALGEAAAELVLRQLSGESLEQRIVHVATALTYRQSCGCSPAKSRAATLEPAPAAVHEGPDLLEHKLASQLIYPATLEPRQPTQVWPGVTTIVQALRAALQGSAAPEHEMIQQAWVEAVTITPHLRVLYDLLRTLKQEGRTALAAAPDPAVRERLEVLYDELAEAIADARLFSEVARSVYLERAIQYTYELNYRIIDADPQTVRNPSWLAWTPVVWGCLGEWVRGPQGTLMEQLTISGAYSEDERFKAPVGEILPTASFPPANVLEFMRVHPQGHMVFLIPVRTKSHDWGYLALLGPLDVNLSTGRESMSEWASLVGVALDRHALMQELDEQQQALIAAKTSAEEANRLKSQFLHNMSHELRTPLNAIIGFADLIGEERFANEEKQQYLQKRILANADHLLGLINDILDLAKIESGKMELFCEEVELKPLLQGVMSTAIGLTKDKGLVLNLEVAESLPPVWVDKTRIRQVLLNLLSNAAKFTSSGSISLRALPGSDGFIQVEVQDTGIGIAPEDQDLVFEEFRQVQGDMTREYQGTGLGLPICRTLVAMHGGMMWLQSTRGQGSTFFFTIPIAPRILAQRSSAQFAERPLIAVVDDDLNTQFLLRQHLESNGYRVHPIVDSRQAVDTIVQARPQLVVLDIMMPHLDGWEVLAALRANPLTAAIPVVMCSIVDEGALGIALGANGHLSKPIREEEVLRIIRHWVGTSSTVMVVDDHADARLIMREMLERIGCYVVEADDGLAALEALEAGYPDLLVLDLMMPRMDGFEMLRRLREDPAWRSLPVVILTAKDLTREERAWLQEQALSCIQKSHLTSDEFLRYIRSLINEERGMPSEDRGVRTQE